VVEKKPKNLNNLAAEFSLRDVFVIMADKSVRILFALSLDNFPVNKIISFDIFKMEKNVKQITV